MKQRIIQSFLLMLLILIPYSIYFILPAKHFLYLTSEDGILENISAIFFLLSSFCYFYIFFTQEKKHHFSLKETEREFFFFFFGVLFFFGFGEEISWGQRIFNFQTPEALKQINYQKEFNLHNIIIFNRTNADGTQKNFFELLLNFDRLFSLFWFSFCFVIPLMNKMSKKISLFLKKINFPVVSLWIGKFALINYLVSKCLEPYVPDGILLRHFIEIKETNFSLIFFIIGIYFILHFQDDESKNINVKK